MDYLLRRLVKAATRRGMRGEHWAWFALAAGAFALQRARRHEDPVVYSRRVTAGDRLLISIRSPESQPVDDPLPG
ncbi:MAG TPA: hypothetical protein VN793_02945 [Acidimicrobiales bacterium]|nr:hypothetical protein [Acidimicrobiales bacterium]